jgi:phospholipase/carboxylesterase
MKYASIVREAREPKSSMVLLHGLGSDEQDMFGLAQMIDDRVEVICLRAPHSYGPGFAWFDIQWTAAGIKVDQDEYWKAVGNLAHEILTLDKPNLILGGFSQGAMMSLGVVTKFPKLASDCVLLSGRGIESPCPDFNGNIFQGHGIYDEVIPVSEARALRSNLEDMGDRYEYHEYPIGHTISEVELDDLNTWLKRILDLE